MNAPAWLLREAILAVHEQLLSDFGGGSGLRDAGLLDSALGRPENRFAYGQASLVDLAAAYAFGIVKNHPFVDGNKRTGFTAAIMFLEINGWRFQASEADAVVRTLALAAGAMTESEYAAWLEANSSRRTDAR
jgi:death-on-curing protein